MKHTPAVEWSPEETAAFWKKAADDALKSYKAWIAAGMPLVPPPELPDFWDNAWKAETQRYWLRMTKQWR